MNQINAQEEVQLHVEPPEGPAFVHQVDQYPLVMGRSPQSDLMLADRFLSRHHARLFIRDNLVFVEDLNSRNGTAVNGHPLQQARALENGDLIEVSNTKIRLRRASDIRPDDPTGELRHSILRSAVDLLEPYSSADLLRDQNESGVRRYAERLRILNDVHEALGSLITQGDFFDLILDRVFLHLQPEKAVIFLKNADGEFSAAAARPVNDTSQGVPLSRHLVDEVATKGMAALVFDTATDQRFSAADSIHAAGIRTLMAAPLLSAGGTIGMLVLWSRARVKLFSEEDMDLLVSLASVAAMKIVNAALAEEAAQRRVLEEELSIARRIQNTLLPSKLPDIEGYEVYGRNLPFHGVSGDYFEVYPRNEGKEFVFLVADVSGKGVSASLLTASLEALSAAPIEDGHPPEVVCNKLTRLLYSRTPPERYATLFLAFLEPETGTLTYTNAGHLPGMVITADGELKWLEVTGVPIGLMPRATYRQESVQLANGDMLAIFTDGITEAENSDGQEYGLKRVGEVGVRLAGKPLAEVATGIGGDLDAFSGEHTYTDDRTLVILRRLP